MRRLGAILEMILLSPNSPMIDAGVHIPGINDDYQGRAPRLSPRNAASARFFV
jgi:hypothetical protein